MPYSYYQCGDVCIGDERPKVKFSKYARHNEDVTSIDAIASSVENKIEAALGLKVIGMTSAGIKDGKNAWIFHLGKKEDGKWNFHGHVTVSC